MSSVTVRVTAKKWESTRVGKEGTVKKEWILLEARECNVHTVGL